MVSEPEQDQEKIILSTAGNPFHIGHQFLLFKAAKKFPNRELYIDISANADKAISEEEAKKRLSKIQIYGVGKIFSFRSTFVEKSFWMNTVFPIGSDTATRIVDPVYYSSEYHRDYCLDLIQKRNCLFYVFDRGTEFFYKHPVFVRSEYSSPAISSTELRGEK